MSSKEEKQPISLDETNEIIERVEQTIIADLLNDDSVVEEAFTKLEPRDFANKNYAIIFNVISELYREGKAINQYLVIDYITNHKELIFEQYDLIITSIANQYITSADVDEHIDLIKNASIKRQMDAFANELVETRIDFTNFNDQIFALEKKFLDITNSKKTSNINSINQITKNYQKRLEQIYTSSSEISGTPSGYEGIDRITNGFQPGDLIILAARPGVGKTALALNFLLNAAE